MPDWKLLESVNEVERESNYSAGALPCRFEHVIAAENMRVTAKQKAGNQSNKKKKWNEGLCVELLDIPAHWRPNVY